MVVIFIVGYLLRVYAVELSFVECSFGVFVFLMSFFRHRGNSKV